jgi:hypothetical protein
MTPFSMPMNADMARTNEGGGNHDDKRVVWLKSTVNQSEAECQNKQQSCPAAEEP